MSLKIKRRSFSLSSSKFSTNISPLMRRIYLSRGVQSESELQYDLQYLPHWNLLKDIEKAIDIIVKGVVENQKILIIGDFDADGATSTALAISMLNKFAADKTCYLVPDRFKYGYGLSPEIVEHALSMQPDIIITVDNGITSYEGVKLAKNHDIQVIITDHHLSGDKLPCADAIINPNQADCAFPNKNIAGVGVIFYVMCAVRSMLDKQGWFSGNRKKPNMATCLDLVALGTVADVVHLNYYNRILVKQGLERIRAGKSRIGIYSLIEVAKRNYAQLTTTDISFALAPRLNAAGRLENMSQGIELLLAQSPEHAKSIALELNKLNIDRRSIEKDMCNQAMDELNKICINFPEKLPAGLCFYQPDWHEGVVGILASRIKEKTHRPVVVFADSNKQNNLIKGSARSINGFHIRDALAEINRRFPKLMIAFGGHAMAAGLTLSKKNFVKFRQVFIEIAKDWLTSDQLMASIITDGSLKAQEITLENAEMLIDIEPWGAGFPEPIFDGVFNIIEQKILGNKHLGLTLEYEYIDKLPAILFNVDLTLWPNPQITCIHAVYKLGINHFRGKKNLNMLLKYITVDLNSVYK